MFSKTENVACRASYCKVFSGILWRVSFSTATAITRVDPGTRGEARSVSAMAIFHQRSARLQLCSSRKVNGNYRSTGRRLVCEELSAAVAVIPSSEVFTDAALGSSEGESRYSG